MNLRKSLAALVAISMLSIGAADARSMLAFIFKEPRTEKNEYRPGHLSTDEALSLYSAQQRQNSFSACTNQFPGNRPLDLEQVPAEMKPMALCSNNFAVLYSQTSKSPLVVVERLNSERLRNAKGNERTNAFFADPRVPKNARAELSDFRNQKLPVDRGHMSPAGDAPDQRAMAQSFALSNMVAQDPASNRKVWNKVEQDTRKYALRAAGNVFVFSGPIFDDGHGTVGKNQVWKPTRLYKLVYDEANERAWAFVLPNAESHLERPMDYAAFVKITHLNLLKGMRIAGPTKP